MVIGTDLASELLGGLDVPGDVGARFPVEQLDEVLHHALIKVLTAEMSVAVRR